MKPTTILYQAKNGEIELRGDVKQEAIWATQADIAKLFGVDQSVVSRHIRNVFKDEEVIIKRNMQKMHIANSDKMVNYYSLDLVLSVGYRTNSKVAIDFRKWATQTLRQHLTKGYTIHSRVIKSHYAEFQEAIKNIKYLLPPNSAIDNESILELISAFANTWVSLDAYDKDLMSEKGVTKKQAKITAEELTNALKQFKTTLIQKGEATDLFGSEKSAGILKGIVGNVMQSFGGKAVYATVEEKAAHLLYFIVKNHPFVDGNKRSGAYAFIWFLHRAGILDRAKMSPPALTALTLFIAESNPKSKERMTKLVLQLLKK